LVKLYNRENKEGNKKIIIVSYRKRHIKHKIHKIKPRKSIFKRPAFWLAFFLAVIFSASVYLIFFYSGLQINSILVSGNQKVSAEELKNLVSKNISKNVINLANLHASTKSILLANTDNLSKEILEKFPIIETANVNKNLPQTLNVVITERKQAGIFCNASFGGEGRCYSIDENGVIFEDLTEIPADALVIWHPLGGQVVLAQNVLDKNIANAVVKTEKMLKDNFQIGAKNVILPNSGEMDIKTSEGWNIYFDPNSDIDLQITKVKLLLSGEISESARKNLQYIDMRFKDRAYYK